MVDRGRFPIRPAPSSPSPRDEVTDPVEADDELDIETSSLAERELARLLEQDDMDFGSTTVQINARELDALLVQARPVPGPPPSRPMLTTQPYDAVTAYVLLDNDVSPRPADALEDAEAVALEDDDSPEIDAAVDIDADDTPEPAAPVVATPPTAVVPDPEPAAPAPPSIAPAGPTSVPSPTSTPLPTSTSTPSPTSTPLPTAIPPSPARASFPSADAEWPGADDRKRRTRMVIAVAAALAVITILYLVLTESEPPPPAPVPAAVTVAPPPAPIPSAPKPRSPAEIDARKALSLLRDGVGDCVRRAIGTLPGSSPAVPPTMKQTSGVGYTALPADWKTAVWSCAKFRHDAPMQFQIQWQSVKPGAEALGLAWIDDDGDGEPDRALGFRATAKGAHDVDLGDVGPVEMRPVLPVR